MHPGLSPAASTVQLQVEVSPQLTSDSCLRFRFAGGFTSVAPTNRAKRTPHLLRSAGQTMKWRAQYRLRTLLAVVTASAILSWAYLYAWPSWQLHQEQSQFEHDVKQLKAGT